jgi:transcriptional regulator with XRE-family HTH domain
MRKLTPESKSISQIWKVGRLLIGKTQVELSKEMGISQSNISKFESMVLEPSASDWYQFCQMAGISAHKSLELGYIDGCSKFKSKLYRTSAFKLPLKYRGDFAIKVRETIPFKECVISDLGEANWESFLKDIGIVPELFFVYDYQMSLRFIFDLADWYQKKMNVSIFEKVGKHFANLENHGVFGKSYSRQKTSNDLLHDLMENQPYYQRAFRPETNPSEKGFSVKLVVDPEIYDVFGEVKTRQYLLHKINVFQQMLNQNTDFKGDFKTIPNDFTFLLDRSA